MANEERTRPTPPKSAPIGPPPRRKKRRGRLVYTLLTLLLIAGLVFFAVKYYQTRKEADNLSNPQTAAAQQTTDLVNKVSKLVELPAGQTPTIATVTDISKLQGQAFFIAAQNGDKVLIYTQAKKAILYRPSTNKVIEIAPLNLGTSQSSGQTPAGTTSTNSTKAKQ